MSIENNILTVHEHEMDFVFQVLAEESIPASRVCPGRPINDGRDHAAEQIATLDARNAGASQCKC